VGENRTTGYQHNLDGKLKKLTSYNTATGNQVTEWIYGVTEASGSSINSNDLLWKKILPVGSAGGDGTSIYKYNRQDQATEFQDAADTIHSYAYDKLGRNTSDIASNLATGVDASILKIVRDYDDHLRLSKVGSYATAGATTPLHEVSYAYNSFGQTTADRQEHDGAVDSGTREVGYQFAPGTANTIRPTGMTYPSSTTTAIKYTAGTAADKLSRPDILALGGADEVAYRYLGLGRIVGATYLATHSTAPVHMTYEDGGTGTAGDKYSGLDSFGRVVETQWKKGSTMMQNASYGYDRASNRKWRRDDLAHALGGAQQNRHDNFYWHDGLYQIKERQLGNLTGTAPNYTGIDNLQQNEDWCYDASGNWQKYGNTDDSLLQTRTHNTANEITSVANPTGVIQPAYDKAGNQTADIAPGGWDRQFDLKWDAWNRLIQVTHSSTVIQSNAYDGLSRRITSSDGTDTVHYYYDQSWRAVEEYLNSDSTPNRRFLWGLRSRWDLAKRERNDSGSLNEKRYVLYDAMDPVAICDEDGDIMQRFEYSPFGETTFLKDDFSPDATPADWNWLFHGEFRDRETGYYNYGYRYYNPTTGRWPSRDPIGEEGGLNLYGFVGNGGIKYFDILGLAAAPDGFRGIFDSKDKAGYYGSRQASKWTLADKDQREFCGIICCNKKSRDEYIISTPHAGNTRDWVMENGIKRYKGKASCNPHRTQELKPVRCPSDDWTLVATYHSHPEQQGNERFSEGDYDHVNEPDPPNIPLYLGTPSGKVKRLDPDLTEKDKDKPWHDGTDVPDSWGYENKWNNANKK
jgi:RHS repeat-associated protein